MAMATSMVGRDITTAFAGKGGKDRTIGEVLLRVEHLWVDMPGETVRDVSFQVREREIFGIGGLAGQGKLGITNGIMGMFPAGGSVFFRDKPLRINDPTSPLEAGISAVYEDRRGVGLLMEEPISWNIIFTALQMQGRFLKPILGGLVKIRDENEITRSARDYIEMLDIKCVSERQRVQDLSGGNQQKVCLAKAFETKPSLLFVSEPTRGIDVGAKRMVLEALRKYNDEYGTTIVMVSSELEELRSICDRIAIIDSGRIAGTLSATAPSTDFGVLMLGGDGREKKVV
jgi:simple sugar transport system ATP-binding protein